MSEHVDFLLLGLANGAVFASLALALVITFRSSGVINFATSSVALIAAYLFSFLRNGELLLLLPGLPKSISLGAKLGVGPAMAITVVVSSLLGLLLYGVTFRPLRTASPVAKAVASLGVMIALTGLVLQRLGTAPVQVPKIFPTSVYSVGSIHLSADRLWFAVSVIAVALILMAMYRFTRFGLQTRAAAETEKGALVSGISPDRVAAINWMISGAVAGLAGVLIAPIAPLVPYSYTLFIVPALAAAIVGGFQRVLPAVAAGLAIGMLQSEVTYLKTQQSWLPSSGGPELVPLLLILVVLVVRAKPLPSRGAIEAASLGRSPRPRRLAWPAAAGLVIGLVAILMIQGAWRAALVTSLIFAIISLSLVVVTGYAGQVSLAQLTLAGVGGFLVAQLSADWGVPFPLAPLLAAVGAMVIGVVVGLPALRIRGLPVAIVTLSLAVALQALWFRNSDLVGSNGRDVRPPSLFGLDLGPGSGSEFPRPQFSVLVLLVLIGVAVAVALLRRSRLGSAMLAVRTNERAAAAAGINVVATKLAAFAIGAFIAGLGGSLLGYKLGNVTFDSFDVILGLGLFATVYVTGITSVSGGIAAGLLGFGGITYFATTQWLTVDSYWFQIVTGILLVVSVILNPDGVTGALSGTIDRLRTREGNDRELSDVPRSLPTTITPIIPGETVLSLQDVRVSYGGVVALDGVSLDVKQRTITGLIGPNGAGKTTLVDAISGFCTYTGSVRLDDRPIDDATPHQRIRSGLGRTFQGLELWNDLTVEENVLVGYAAGDRSADEVDEMLAMLHLGPIRERLAGELSQGERQMVSIARSLVNDPTVLLLDEPAAGLDSSESEWLAERLRDIRAGGVTILLIDHDMNLVLSLCDHIEVLDFGRVIASGPPASIRTDRAVMEAYLGSAHGQSEVEVG